MRLLVVDDDQVFREELAELLASEGHEARTEPSVARAVEALENDDFDLVFTDLKMPRHGGLELLETIRSRWPRTLTVMVTGFATVDTAVDAMKLGAFDYLRKPFKIEQLRAVLDLAAQEHRFHGPGGSSPSVDTLARSWVDAAHIPVLHVTSRTPARYREVSVVAPGEGGAGGVRDLIEGFLARHPSGGVIVEDVDRLFSRARRRDLLAFVETLRDRTKGHGPLVVTYDPSRLSKADAADLRSLLVGAETSTMLESLSNPIRRAVLRRAGESSITFSQAMEAAGLDDSPKLSFHLRRLVEDGLLEHAGDEYRITERGQGSLKLTAEWDAVAARGPVTNAALPLTHR